MATLEGVNPKQTLFLTSRYNRMFDVGNDGLSSGTAFQRELYRVVRNVFAPINPCATLA